MSKRSLTFLLAMSMLAAVSCGSGAEPSDTTVQVSESTSSVETEPEEKLGIVRKLLSDEVFNLPELERHQARASIGGHYIGIVSVGRDEHQAACRDPEEFRALGE